MNNAVIYTAVFGGYDSVHEPKVIPKGYDFVCFTDVSFRSRVWQVRPVTPEFTDMTRNARKYKILPHRYLGSYTYSVWIDGNILVRGNINELTKRYLAKTNIAVFNHAETKHRDRGETPNSKDCIYQEAEDLIVLHQRGRYKDDPEIIRRQVERYQKEGYPAHYSLLHSSVLLRKHNEKDVVRFSEAWWAEVKRGSKRDQLSFNYVAWKHGTPFTYIKGNVRNNPYFLYLPHKK